MKARAARLLVLCCITALTAATAASAGRPTFNPVCDGTKIEPVVSGTYALPIGNIDITVRETPTARCSTSAPTAVSWRPSSPRAGPPTRPRAATTRSATDLHAPLNPHSGYWYDLSYLCINTGGGEG